MKNLPEFPENPFFEGTKVFRIGADIEKENLQELIEKGRALGWQFMALSSSRIHFTFPDPANPLGLLENYET
jgi:hypothetical protein